jgi:hypothetical protein
MCPQIFRMLNGAAIIAIAAAATSASTAAHAQAGVYPDGSMWVNTPSGTTWTNPAGSVKLDKSGDIVDVSPNCQNVTSIKVQQAKSVCWKIGNNYVVYTVGYVVYTCYDNGKTTASRITSYAQATGRKCDPAEEAFDRGEAQTDWQETWRVSTTPFIPPGQGGGDQPPGGGGDIQPPTGGGSQSNNGGTQTGGGTTQTGGGGTTQTGGGGTTQTGGGGTTQTGGGGTTQTGGGSQPATNTSGQTSGGPLKGGWPTGADWVQPDNNGGWTIHYPDGRTVQQTPDGKFVEQTPPTQPSTTTPSTTTPPSSGNDTTPTKKANITKKTKVRTASKKTGSGGHSSRNTGSADQPNAGVEGAGLDLDIGLGVMGMRRMRGGQGMGMGRMQGGQGMGMGRMQGSDR